MRYIYIYIYTHTYYIYIIHSYIYIYIYILYIRNMISSASCRVASTDIPDPLQSICKQSRPGFEFGTPYPFPPTTTTSQLLLLLNRNNYKKPYHQHQHYHVVPLARISLTLFRHSSLSFIASGRSSEVHPLSSHSCWMYVRAGRPAFARPYVGVHKSTSLMSSSLLLQHCPACLVRLTWIVFVMGGRWPYSWCLVGCRRQDLFNIARSNLVYCRLASSSAV